MGAESGGEKKKHCITQNLRIIIKSNIIAFLKKSALEVFFEPQNIE